MTYITRGGKCIGPLVVENFEVARKYFRFTFNVKYFQVKQIFIKNICTWVSLQYFTLHCTALQKVSGIKFMLVQDETCIMRESKKFLLAQYAKYF